MPLNDAFAQTKDCLGSYQLAARDLTEDARARRLTLAVRVIWPDHTEQAFILRPAFWRWYEIYDAIRPSVDDAISSQRGWATVREVRENRASRVGRWYFFVGRRRFDRLYSTAAPSKSVLPHKIEIRTWKPGEESEWLADAQVRYPRQPGESATKYSRRLFPLMEKDFRGRGGPRWAKWEVLRRRLYVWQRKKIKEKK